MNQRVLSAIVVIVIGSLAVAMPLALVQSYLLKERELHLSQQFERVVAEIEATNRHHDDAAIELGLRYLATMTGVQHAHYQKDGVVLVAPAPHTPSMTSAAAPIGAAQNPDCVRQWSRALDDGARLTLCRDGGARMAPQTLQLAFPVILAVTMIIALVTMALRQHFFHRLLEMSKALPFAPQSALTTEAHGNFEALTKHVENRIAQIRLENETCMAGFDTLRFGLAFTDENLRVLKATPELRRILNQEGLVHFGAEASLKPLLPDYVSKADLLSGLEFMSSSGRRLSVVACKTDPQRLRSGYTVEVRDCTATHNAQAKSRQREKLQSIRTLTGGFAHDFNNLLTVIQGNAELLSGLGQSQSEDEALRSIVSAAQRGAALTGDLLCFARKQNLVVEPINTDELLSEIAAQAREKMPDTITIIRNQTTAWSANCDKRFLGAALRNLINNACAAMPQGGTIEISVRPGKRDGKDFVLFEVRDTGIGMDDTLLRRAHEPFFTTKRAGDGAGLGLAMAHGFAEQSNGWMEIASQPDHGTVVTLALPAVSQHQGPESVANANSSPWDSSSLTVLIVEPDDTVSTTLITQIEDLGHQALRLRSRQCVLAMPPSHWDAIDVILCNANLDNACGADFMADIQAIIGGVPVIFTVGNTRSANKQKYIQNGGYVLGAPVLETDLQAILKKIAHDEEVAAMHQAN